MDALHYLKAPAGSEWWVYDGNTVIAHFDDEMKARRFVQELRKPDNDRLLTLQEEAIQAAERSSGLDERREEEVWGNTSLTD